MKEQSEIGLCNYVKHSWHQISTKESVRSNIITTLCIILIQEGEKKNLTALTVQWIDLSLLRSNMLLKNN